jgi:hypothetical protein
MPDGGYWMLDGEYRIQGYGHRRLTIGVCRIWLDAFINDDLTPFER